VLADIEAFDLLVGRHAQSDQRLDEPECEQGDDEGVAAGSNDADQLGDERPEPAAGEEAVRWAGDRRDRVSTITFGVASSSLICSVVAGAAASSPPATPLRSSTCPTTRGMGAQPRRCFTIGVSSRIPGVPGLWL